MNGLKPLCLQTELDLTEPVRPIGRGRWAPPACVLLVGVAGSFSNTPPRLICQGVGSETMNPRRPSDYPFPSKRLFDSPSSPPQFFLAILRRLSRPGGHVPWFVPG